MRMQQANAASGSAAASGSTDATKPEPAPTEEAVVDVPWSRAVAGTHAEQASRKTLM